nr:heterodimeric geranylgeranyl pyrophosphate synthase small subunit, chloroplastic-like [Ziziphus jujuba var. spinosa]
MAAYIHLHGHPRVYNLFVSNPNRPSLCYSPMIITMSQQDQSHWSSINADIEAHLKQAIPLRPPLSVFEPVHHFTFSAPKNTAPALCIAACELVGGHRDQAIAAASALHLMHAATFTHENLPLTDRPKPKPMIHHAHKPNIQLLIPDGMVPFGFELLANSDDPAQDNSDRVLRVIVEIARAMGSNGVVEGLYEEFLVEQSDGEGLSDVSLAATIKRTCEKKEGELHACAAACGAILGGGSEEEIEKLRKYGLYVGMRQGYLNRVGKKEKELERVVEELRNLALKELQHFEGGKVEAISSFVVGV